MSLTFWDIATISTYENVHHDIEIMCDPESTETDAPEVAGGKHVHEGQHKEQQDAGHACNSNNRVLDAELQPVTCPLEVVVLLQRQYDSSLFPHITWHSLKEPPCPLLWKFRSGRIGKEWLNR